MFCNRCGTPLRAGDRFCPRCGAPIDPARSASSSGGPAGPELSGRHPHHGRAVGIVIAMLVMVLLLLAAAVWSQRDALSGLFEPEPMPTARPGQGAEKVVESEPHPATDAAGVPWIDPDPNQPEQDMARALLTDAVEEAFALLYGEDTVSRSAAKKAFCNLTAGGYETALDKAAEINGTTSFTLSRWDGYAMSKPLMAGNCGYLAVLFYAVEEGSEPLSFETEAGLLCFLWTGSEWRLDASDATEALWPRLFENQLTSPGLRRAAERRLPTLQFGPCTRVIRPVIPGVCDAMPTEVFLTKEGRIIVEFWAFNGTDEAVKVTTLSEVSLRESDGTVYFALYDLAIEPLQLAPGEGQLVTVSIPPEEFRADIRRVQSVTCGVWLEV